MDKLVLMSAAAAKANMERMDNVANNLANANTPGFRGKLLALQSAPIQNKNPMQVREYMAETTVGDDLTPGALMSTGRDLDLALQNPQNWFAVQDDNGQEAYTRAGSFAIGNNGSLVTMEGRLVLDEGGAEINIPAGGRFAITNAGVVQVTTVGDQGEVTNDIARIKIAGIDPQQMVRGDDGFFRTLNGQPAPQDENPIVAVGYIEGSNVNPAKAMVQMIETARNYEMNLKMISSAQDNSKSSNSLFSNR